jgi:hypothetical protein
MSSTEAPAAPNADIDELRDHCRAFIDRMDRQSQATAMARTQLDEMIYWLRVARDREVAR